MNDIYVELIKTNILIRHPCHVCGGYSEKVTVLAEGRDSDRNVVVRVCETCLENGNIDVSLERHAAKLEENAKFVRSLKGRLKVPTFLDWKKLINDNDDMARREYEERTGKPFPGGLTTADDDPFPF